MMEMRASRLVAGFHDRVVGIAGERRGAMLAVFFCCRWLCLCLCRGEQLLLCIVVSDSRKHSICVEFVMLSNPFVMEMRACRLVAGFHDRVVGIAGECRGLLCWGYSFVVGGCACASASVHCCETF
jgi:hypothetical protein